MEGHASFQEKFDALLEKYSELMVGEATSENVELIRTYSLFTHMNKTMPALVKHWLAENPEAKKELQLMFEKVKTLNEALRATKENQ